MQERIIRKDVLKQNVFFDSSNKQVNEYCKRTKEFFERSCVSSRGGRRMHEDDRFSLRNSGGPYRVHCRASN